MAKQLAYALVTPYTIRKSRTGAILARLLGRASSELVAARMFATTREMAEKYAASVQSVPDPEEERYRELIREYIRQNLAPDPDGHRHRALMLVFYGENAITDIASVTGRLRISGMTGETIRDAYGDLVWNADGSVRYFEPAVVVADSQEVALRDLRMWHEFAKQEPAVLEKVCVYEQPERVEQTLVLIKPDSWRQRSARPGAIIDMFSRTGLRIIGCKLCQMSVGQALEFYGPVKDALRRRLAPGVGERARVILERELGVHLKPEVATVLAEQVGVPVAEDQFARIIEFITGVRPDQCEPEQVNAQGRAKCLALVYEGVDAVRKIRDVLGPTDPTKAPDGTVRREFGSDVMVNTAHASDSPASARREMGILQIGEGGFVSVVGQLIDEVSRQQS